MSSRVLRLLLALAASGIWAPARAADRPNIVYVLADDLGYGDVKALNPDGKIATPNMDHLAAQGMTFTDAHGSASVCTPSRYSILTGRYTWRSRLQSGVLGGVSPHLIDPARLTVPALLKQHGYTTACIGKWHLGMDWTPKDAAARPFGDSARTADPWNVDYTKPIINGPTAVGFDYFFGIAGSLDMPPFAFIENDHVTALPTVEKQWGSRKGPAAPGFEAVDVVPALVRQAVGYLDAHARSSEPFFLYLPLTSPHTPLVPSPEWQGKSGINAYADFVMETDWALGEVLRALDRDGLAQSTLVIFASDNGAAPAANFKELAAHGHNPSYVYRGRKSDIWDGGHRIPLLARWPGKVQPGSTSHEVVGLSDFLATCADILGVMLPSEAGEDSVSILPVLLGRAAGPVHEAIVHHSVEGRFSIREGAWKLEICPGSGGNSKPTDPTAARKELPALQLYDMATDVGETKNVEAAQPAVVERLTTLLEHYVAAGRSTAGAPQRNDAPVNIWQDDADDSQGGDAGAD
jgi:arylsulfatase A-like enzyme